MCSAWDCPFHRIEGNVIVVFLLKYGAPQSRGLETITTINSGPLGAPLPYHTTAAVPSRKVFGCFYRRRRYFTMVTNKKQCGQKKSQDCWLPIFRSRSDANFSETRHLRFWHAWSSPSTTETNAKREGCTHAHSALLLLSGARVWCHESVLARHRKDKPLSWLSIIAQWCILYMTNERSTLGLDSAFRRQQPLGLMKPYCKYINCMGK